MTKNLETADRIAKFTLSLMTLIFYFLGVIAGPFAKALMVVSASVIAIYFAKVLFHKDE